MKLTKLTFAAVAAALALGTYSTKAAPAGPTNTVTVALVGQVQQEDVKTVSGGATNYTWTTTNLLINNKALLALIAKDQVFTLPANANLGMIENTFVVLNKDKSIFTNVNSGLLSLAMGTSVSKGKATQTAKSETETDASTSVGTMTYNGTNVTKVIFTLNFLGKDSYTAKDNYTNGIVSESFSGSGAGSGSCLGQNMVIKGSLSGKGKAPGMVED